ncbi:MAG: signal recognition particle receptor subunit alpha, partial [Gemmatimonadaceae bacterium]
MRLLRKKDDVPKRTLWQRVKDIALMDVGVLARGGVSAGSLEQLEQILLESDFGVAVTLRLVADVERLAKRGQIKCEAEFDGALAQGIEDALRAGNSDRRLSASATSPTVVLVVGVNGAGKTTFIGKLADRFRQERKSV